MTDKVQKDHADAIQALVEGHDRALVLASKREEALERRMEAAERQVEGLRGTCVPEEALRQVKSRHTPNTRSLG